VDKHHKSQLRKTCRKPGIMPCLPYKGNEEQESVRPLPDRIGNRSKDRATVSSVSITDGYNSVAPNSFNAVKQAPPHCNCAADRRPLSSLSVPSI